MRPSTLFLMSSAILLALFTLLGGHARHGERVKGGLLLPGRSAVRVYGLTDLCLFTEARYTRHPAMADLHAPFQDHPGALEHFPSGGLISPPPHLSRRHE